MPSQEGKVAMNESGYKEMLQRLIVYKPRGTVIIYKTVTALLK
jgi:hypothetical protein